jgi:hypothetical protein
MEARIWPLDDSKTTVAYGDVSRDRAPDETAESAGLFDSIGTSCGVSGVFERMRMPQCLSSCIARLLSSIRATLQRKEEAWRGSHSEDLTIAWMEEV